jgi:ring-1,2-phenylacetyl-CoA epoxidase subunit PaaB
MTDQWPRFEVFKQDEPGQPHRNVGSVHAPDAELALLNARDVFARRPSCHSLWVVPAGAVLARTAEELAADGLPAYSPSGSGESYAVFQKRSQRQAMTYVDYAGEVTAGSAAEALALALQSFADEAAVVWWVCPARLISRSEPADTAALYDPAREKRFRMPNQYRTVFTMQKIRRQGEEEA